MSDAMPEASAEVTAPGGSGGSLPQGWRRDLVLSYDETEALRQWAAEVDADPYEPDFPQYDARLRSRLASLPERFVAALAAFGNPDNDVGVLRLRGIPIPADLRSTPSVPFMQVRARIGTEPIMLALAMLVGEAMSIPLIRSGHRVHNIYPLPEDAETQKASSSTSLLQLHTEMSFQEPSPDALAILCLRASGSPPETTFCDLGSVWAKLGAREQSLLREPAFAFRYSGPETGRKFFDMRLPFAKATEGRPWFQYDVSAAGVTDDHHEALELFREGMSPSVSALTLDAGDLTLIDNRRMVHGRSPMKPGYSGGDRWLQRSFIRWRTPANTMS